MSLTHQEEWDTEEVLAFVYDVKAWKQFDDAEKIEWCRRVKYIRDNVVTEAKPWTNERLAGLFGLAVASLKSRFTRSEAISANGDHVVGRKPHQQVSDARRALRNPDIEGLVKADLVADALTDPEVAAAVARRIANDPDLVRLVNQGTALNVERRHSHHVVPDHEAAINLDSAWQGWLNRINAILIAGARLASESQGSTLNAQSELASYIYQQITERKLDAEIRELLESYEVSS